MQNRFFGQFLVDEGEVDPIEIEAAVAELDRRHMAIGALSVKRGVLSGQRVEHLLELQRDRFQPFGELAIELGWMTPTTLEELLEEQRSLHMHIGEMLVEQGVLDESRLWTLLDRFDREQKEFDALTRVRAERPDEAELIASILDIFPKLLFRLSGLRAKPGAVGPAGDVPRALCLRASIDLGDNVEFGLACDPTFARKATAGRQGGQRTELADEDVRALLADLIEHTAQNALIAQHGEDAGERIGDVEWGWLPPSGVTCPLTTTYGRARLQIDLG